MGDRLTEEPKAEPKSYGDIFDEAFPHYLAMGMSPEEYWDGESFLKVAYRQAFRIRMENEEKIRDSHAWNIGHYVMEAIASVPIIVNGYAPKGASVHDYPDKPRLVQLEEQRKEEVRKKNEDNHMMLQIAMFQAMAEEFNKNFSKRQEKQDAVRT